MALTPIDQLPLSGLRNIIDNHRRNNKTSEPRYVEALAEVARRTGNGLDFDKSLGLIRTAAADKRYLSYKQLADGSGVNWSKVHYAMNDHLGQLIEYAHRRGWPLLSAIVVNQKNVETGEMESETLAGFVSAARALGYTINDERAFLTDQQQRVFAWARQS